MVSLANSYLSNSKLLSLRNMDREANKIGARCGSKRTPPKQFNNRSSAMVFPAVPYLWGGFDLPSAFNSAMDGDKVAGNRNTDVLPWQFPSTCPVAGVDCSGFVSRAWNLPQPYTTVGLAGDNISKVVTSVPSLMRGDMLDKVGWHVRLVDYVHWTSLINTDGVYVWESTVDSSNSVGPFDGVVYKFRTWSEFEYDSTCANRGGNCTKYAARSYQCVTN